jgi:hypothetical protein
MCVLDASPEPHHTSSSHQAKTVTTEEKGAGWGGYGISKGIVRIKQRNKGSRIGRPKKRYEYGTNRRLTPGNVR